MIRRLREIQNRGDEDFEERGLETVYLAYGMATWKPKDDGRPPQAAVIMVPIGVEGKVSRVTLVPRGDLEVNIALTYELEDAYGCAGTGATLEQLLADTDELSPALRMQKVFESIKALASDVPGFHVSRHGVIANFAFQKQAMVRDLQRWKNHIAGHDIVAAVAGEATAKRDQSVARLDVNPRELDNRMPEQEFLVMDADSSQLRAITSIAGGQSGVIIGPPGTGKSQTIANLISELVAHGQRVLFVAEKRAALDVVKDRLTNRGLGDLVLDLHGALSRKQIMAQFSSALDMVGEVLEPNAEDLHRAFKAQRVRLNEHVERLHRRRDPSGLSSYELIGKILSLKKQGAGGRLRWKGSVLQVLTRERIAHIEDTLDRAAAEPLLFLRRSSSPWTNAALHDAKDVQEARDLVDQLIGNSWPELDRQTARCVQQLGLRRPAALSEYVPVLEKVRGVNQLLADYESSVLELDLGTLASNLAPGRKPASAFWATMTNDGYRAAKRRVLDVRRGKVGGARLLTEIEKALKLKTSWPEIASGNAHPEPYDDVDALEAAYIAVHGRIDALRRYFTLPAETTRSEYFQHLLTSLATDRQTPAKIPQLRHYEREIESLGAGAYLEELQRTEPSADYWIRNLRYDWLCSCWDETILHEPELAVFNGRNHDGVVEEFKRLDKARLEAAILRVKWAYGEAVVRAANQNRDQELLVKRQANLRARHLPFRELVRRAPDMVTSIKPCWMVSPLAVSQLLEGTRQYFDAVIFDEASQVRPEDAVTSILRGRSVVVAGDPKQLPPTQFFAAERDEEEESPSDELTAGFESILNVMLSFLPKWPLDWHYRSRDERLIAFSNHHIYDDRLVTFPSDGGAVPAVHHTLAPQIRPRDADELSASTEVARVVELVLEHAEKAPGLSLGVIALGIKHANRIQAELAKSRREHTHLDAFFDAHPNERFFIKNLERVQGDERDGIILSVGYGKDGSGKLPYRFGPLLSEGGFRRLNVAVTRAKQRMTVVSSFSHEDMDPARSTKRGVELLRLYLAYAASRGAKFGDAGPLPVARNEFEVEVQETLELAGLRVLPQFGASKYRIDLVIQHPTSPGRYVLAIECDGAAYHSSPTARDRDRLRQEHLEARGWKFIRVWSVDWYGNRDLEVQRLLTAYEDALRRYSDGDVPYTQRSIPIAAATDHDYSVERTKQRGPRPYVRKGLAITAYAAQDLDAIAWWLLSDGRLRTDEELLAEMMRELGFQKRGHRIEAALRQAIHRMRPRSLGSTGTKPIGKGS